MVVKLLAPYPPKYNTSALNHISVFATGLKTLFCCIILATFVFWHICFKKEETLVVAVACALSFLSTREMNTSFFADEARRI